MTSFGAGLHGDGLIAECLGSFIGILRGSFESVTGVQCIVIESEIAYDILVEYCLLMQR